MQTSNFSIRGKDPEAVSISRRIPSWYEGRHYEPLAPPADLVDKYVAGLIDAIQYEKNTEIVCLISWIHFKYSKI